MIEVRETVSEADVRKILSRPREIETATGVSADDFIKKAFANEPKGATLFEDDVPIAAGALTKIQHPFAVVWLIASVDLRPYRETLFHEVRSRVSAALDEGIVLLATVTRGQEKAERFVRGLGFKAGPATENASSDIYYLKAPK